MTTFQVWHFPEDYGENVIDYSVVTGKAVDIEGDPVKTKISAELNTLASAYKITHSFEGDEVITESSEIDGSWSLELPDTDSMSDDSYYRITIAGRTVFKVLADYPPVQSLNMLRNY